MSSYEQEVQITNKYGLHARPAMQFVDLANTYGSEIVVANGDCSTDAKSIMGVLQLAATKGTILRLRAEGDDAQNALKALATLIAGGFGEE